MNEPLDRPQHRFDHLARVARSETLGEPSLLPSRLCDAAVAVLPVDGAGIAMASRDRLTVLAGASGPDAVAAERLQFTLAEGPCLRAFTTGEPVLVPDLEDTAGLAWREWPAYAEASQRQTPYRCVLAHPLHHHGLVLGSIDLYRRRAADELTATDLADVVAVVDRLNTELADSQVLLRALVGERGWLEPAAADARERTWTAQGVVMETYGLDAGNALALLRAHAYGSGQPLDDLIGDLVTGRRPVSTLDG